MTDEEKTKDDISRLTEIAAGLAKQLADVRAMIRARQVELCGIKVGDIVVDSSGRRVSVATITPVWNRFWITGDLLRADGTTGSRRVQLYENWKKV